MIMSRWIHPMPKYVKEKLSREEFGIRYLNRFLLITHQMMSIFDFMRIWRRDLKIDRKYLGGENGTDRYAL